MRKAEREEERRKDRRNRGKRGRGKGEGGRNKKGCKEGKRGDILPVIDLLLNGP